MTSTSKEWQTHATWSSAEPSANCSLPTVVVSGECQSISCRTKIGLKRNTESLRCRWRHSVCLWRHSIHRVRCVLSARQTQHRSVLSRCRSTCVCCGTQLRQHGERVSLLTKARHRTSGRRRWVELSRVVLHCLSVANLQGGSKNPLPNYH